MAVNGNINVNVSFLDKDEQSNVDTEKTITLSSSDIYTSGKVAIVTGTCGTAGVTINVVPSTYENAAGDAVSFFAGVRRVAFSASGQAVIEGYSGTSLTRMFSRDGSVSVADTYSPDDYAPFTVKSLVPATTSFTVAIYGE